MKAADEPDKPAASTTVDAKKANRLSLRIAALLRGHEHDLIGAALADVLAVWIWCFKVRGSTEETREFRETMLSMHLTGVWNLIEYYDQKDDEAHRPS
jgi:hypothetical protein